MQPCIYKAMQWILAYRMSKRNNLLLIRFKTVIINFNNQSSNINIL
jgi:hypothetical protein